MAAAPFFRTPFNYDRNAISDETGLKCLDKSLTQQSMADEADINVLVERFGLTGHMPTSMRMPAYGDYTGVGDFQSAMEALVVARDDFMAMPAKVRARFHNDPQEFLEFCEDEGNRDEAIRLGLVVPEKAPEPVQAPITAGKAAPVEEGKGSATPPAPGAPGAPKTS